MGGWAGSQRADNCDHRPGIFLATRVGKREIRLSSLTEKRRSLFSSENSCLFPNKPNFGTEEGLPEVSQEDGCFCSSGNKVTQN